MDMRNTQNPYHQQTYNSDIIEDNGKNTDRSLLAEPEFKTTPVHVFI